MLNNLNCKKIDRLIYLTDDELDAAESVRLADHLDRCESCRAKRTEFLATRSLIITNLNHPSDYPDFTIDILRKTESGLTGKVIGLPGRQRDLWSKTASVILVISRIAAVFLLFLFLGEQTIAVRRIKNLENKVEYSSAAGSEGFIDRMTLARAAFSEQEWNELANRFYRTRNSISSNDLLRFRRQVEAHYCLKKIQSPLKTN